VAFDEWILPKESYKFVHSTNLGDFHPLYSTHEFTFDEL
jgi:hypothetical protein